MPVPPSFSLVLARLLEDRDITQRAFATGVGIAPPFVTKILAGGRAVPPGRIDCWADFFRLAGAERAEFIAAALFSGMSTRQQAWVTSLGDEAKLSRPLPGPSAPNASRSASEATAG